MEVEKNGWAGLLGLALVLGLSAPSMTQETSELTEVQRVEYAEKLRHWEATRERLFDRLVEAIEADDRVEAYYVLKRLHGGAAGADGSEFELRRDEVRQHRRILKEIEKDLARMKKAEKITQMGQDTEQGKRAGESYRKARRDLEEQVAYRHQAIERLETEAMDYAEAAILAELPLVFEILSGGFDSSAQADPFATDSTTDPDGR